jgi:hypothetical protein
MTSHRETQCRVNESLSELDMSTRNRKKSNLPQALFERVIKHGKELDKTISPRDNCEEKIVEMDGGVQKENTHHDAIRYGSDEHVPQQQTERSTMFERLCSPEEQSRSDHTADTRVFACKMESVSSPQLKIYRPDQNNMSVLELAQQLGLVG